MKIMRKQAGVTLIEIMVSILIVSFGLLGVAGLLTTGLKSTQGSQHRTQASLLAYDMADRMRTNRQVALDGEYQTSVVAANAIAVSDKTAWQTAVGLLPSGAGTVVMSGTNVFTITIQWDDARVAGGNTAQQFVYKGEI